MTGRCLIGNRDGEWIFVVVDEDPSSYGIIYIFSGYDHDRVDKFKEHLQVHEPSILRYSELVYNGSVQPWDIIKADILKIVN